MKKMLLYFVVAVVLGLLLTLLPLFTLAELTPQTFSRQLEKLEGTYGLPPKYSVVDFEVFAISFTIALVVYVLFKRRIP